MTRGVQWKPVRRPFVRAQTPTSISPADRNHHRPDIKIKFRFRYLRSKLSLKAEDNKENRTLVPTNSFIAPEDRKPKKWPAVLMSPPSKTGDMRLDSSHAETLRQQLGGQEQMASATPPSPPAKDPVSGSDGNNMDADKDSTKKTEPRDILKAKATSDSCLYHLWREEQMRSRDGIKEDVRPRWND